jgi:endonuclease/exonuclease/phosphatase family metal-dependent hydrolase
MSKPPTLRVMTYNAHRCIGCDGVLAPARIARVIAEYEPDVVALQELDVGHARTRHGDQPALIAGLLKMDYHFHPAIAVAEERYGDAILSRHPMTLVRAGPLPTLPHSPWLERRGALLVRVACRGHTVYCLNTHLGLSRRERLAQVEALLGPEWLGRPDCDGPRILCGDFNAWPSSPAYRRVRQEMGDAQAQRRCRRGPCGTYPSRCPFLRIDHVFHSRELTVRGADVPRTRLTRIASDHLPLLVEVALA